MAEHYSKRTIQTANGCLSMIVIVLLVISLTLTITSVVLLFSPEIKKDDGIIGGIIATLFLAGLSWLWFKCWQIVRKNKKNDLEKFRMLRDTVDPDAITRKHMFHAREYFNSANGITDVLMDIGKHLSGWPDFMEVFDKAGACNNLPQKMNGYEAVLYKMRTDLVRCYIGLGHDLDFQKSETLPLALFILKSRRPTLKIRTWNYRKLISANRKDMEISIESSIQEARSISGFLFPFWLRQSASGLYSKYLISLYRFASLVAKSDGNISPEETEWLQKLVHLRLSKDETCLISTSSNIIESEEKAIIQLERLIGLDRVKSEITTLSNYIQVQKLRAEKGLKVSPVSYHCVFTGNPGTGKTTVARIVAGIYRELGVLQKGHLVETDRSGLIAEYVGHTAIKTNKLIDSALDGVLFIDEAYSLVDGGSCDYGKEAIATLLKRMEDNRDRLVVIIAGYTEDMKRFIHSNPGLESRFNRYIEFPDYSVEELAQIFESQAKRYEYLLDEESRTALQEVLYTAVANKDAHFGNGRFVRNLFEKVVECQANRMAADPTVSRESLGTIRAMDIQAAAKG